MKRYLCLTCGLVYDESEGWPDDGIPPGTKWEDVPSTWLCPDCGSSKDDKQPAVECHNCCMNYNSTR